MSGGNWLVNFRTTKLKLVSFPYHWLDPEFSLDTINDHLMINLSIGSQVYCWSQNELVYMMYCWRWWRNGQFILTLQKVADSSWHVLLLHSIPTIFQPQETQSSLFSLCKIQKIYVILWKMNYFPLCSPFPCRQKPITTTIAMINVQRNSILSFYQFRHL